MHLEKIEEWDMIVFWLNFEALFPNIYLDIVSNKKSRKDSISEVCQYINTLMLPMRKIKALPMLWIGFEDYYASSMFDGYVLNNYDIVNEINFNLSHRLTNISKFINLERLISSIGTMNVYNYKNKYRWNMPYTFELTSLVANEICRQYIKLKGEAKKCIVLDCDNVLWGGILSEDGKNNIKLGNSGTGKVYRDFQKYLLTLCNMGVILAVCSKNDIEDVLDIFNNYDEMLLKESNISCFKVNWTDKASNMYSIANELNIGLKSMVFIDDSVFEIEVIRNSFPQVTTILFNKETVFNDISNINFLLSENKDDIEARIATYKTNSLREELKTKYIVYEDFLKELDTQIIISESSIKEYSRISELSLRTNRFTNGIRYTLTELEYKFVGSKYRLYSVKVNDKFGPLGLVGAIGVDDEVLDLFSLSCRALGRFIEDEMLNYIKKNHKIKSYRFVSSGKNNDVLPILSAVLTVTT